MNGNADTIPGQVETCQEKLAYDRERFIYRRVCEKKESYQQYNFERLQEEALSTFFDLAQELINIDQFYQVCVLVPREFLGIDSLLHVLNPKNAVLMEVCSSTKGLICEEDRDPSPLIIKEHPYETPDSIVFPIRGNKALNVSAPFLSNMSILGLFEVYPKKNIDSKLGFFLEKFTNRIGFQLHQKLLIQQNIDHLKFINQLVSDIEHNVINPNMHYKLFLMRFHKGLQVYRTVEDRLRGVLGRMGDQAESPGKEMSDALGKLSEMNHNMETEWAAFSKHYEHTSLFLETLLRRDHFQKGTYVLRRQSCNFLKEIVQPLFDRYFPMYQKRHIAVDNLLEGVPDDQVTVYVDKGLISQVFDNIFSNAVKYAQEVEDQLGNKIRFFSCNREVLKDFFKKGTDGVRFSFYTTGRSLSSEEAKRIFDGGYRAASGIHEKGTGHGLNFVKNVVEVHGGIVGCEPQKYGNVIYFVLPLK